MPSMEHRTVKTYIIRLVTRYKGDYEAVGRLIGVTGRWVRELEKGKTTGPVMAAHIKRLVK